MNENQFFFRQSHSQKVIALVLNYSVYIKYKDRIGKIIKNSFRTATPNLVTIFSI